MLQTALFVHDPVAAWAHMVCTPYVLAYDVPLVYASSGVATPRADRAGGAPASVDLLQARDPDALHRG